MQRQNRGPSGKRFRISAFVGLAVLSSGLLGASAVLSGHWHRRVAAADADAATVSADDRMAGFPKLVLWAWERPEDLRFVDSDDIGVAFLAATVYLRREQAVVRPRMQPLALPPHMKRIAVVRIESSSTQRALFTDGQRRQAVDTVKGIVQIHDPGAVQIDFDARASERGFYRALLADLRRELPPSCAMSITALASWCLGDNWISDLPVDEAVPMLFRMGTDEEDITTSLRTGEDFGPPVARSSIGISTDEPMRLPSPVGGRRIYVFNPRPWSPQSVERVNREVQQWR